VRFFGDPRYHVPIVPVFPTSPVLDRLASESVLFENACAHFPGTSGSHMTP